jgi:hypothetical protein
VICYSISLKITDSQFRVIQKIHKYLKNAEVDINVDGHVEENGTNYAVTLQSTPHAHFLLMKESSRMVAAHMHIFCELTYIGETKLHQKTISCPRSRGFGKQMLETTSRGPLFPTYLEVGGVDNNTTLRVNPSFPCRSFTQWIGHASFLWQMTKWLYRWSQELLLNIQHCVTTHCMLTTSKLSLQGFVFWTMLTDAAAILK